VFKDHVGSKPPATAQRRPAQMVWKAAATQERTQKGLELSRKGKGSDCCARSVLSLTTIQQTATDQKKAENTQTVPTEQKQREYGQMELDSLKPLSWWRESKEDKEEHFKIKSSEMQIGKWLHRRSKQELVLLTIVLD
jgi:hypothetical protein